MSKQKFIVTDTIEECQMIIDKISNSLTNKLGVTTVWDYPRFICNHKGNYEEIFYVPWLWNNYPYKFCTICPSEQDILPQNITIVEAEVN